MASLGFGLRDFGELVLKQCFYFFIVKGDAIIDESSEKVGGNFCFSVSSQDEPIEKSNMIVIEFFEVLVV